MTPLRPSTKATVSTAFAGAVLRWMVIAALVAAAALAVLIVMTPFPADPALRLQYLQFFVEAFKGLLVGFVAAVLVVTIPQYLSEAKYAFERLRESRRAYSEAHTGVTYLEYRLAVLDYAAAIALIERVHVKKHMAESYDELSVHLGRKGESASHWSDRIAVKLAALTQEIGSDYDRWTASTPQERLARLRRLAGDDPRPISEGADKR